MHLLEKQSCSTTFDGNCTSDTTALYSLRIKTIKLQIKHRSIINCKGHGHLELITPIIMFNYMKERLQNNYWSE